MRNFLILQKHKGESKNGRRNFRKQKRDDGR